MMYFAHETGRMALEPLRLLAKAQSTLLQSPLNPASRVPGVRSLASACAVFGDLARRYPKPAFNLPTTLCDGKPVAVHETIELRKPFAQLKHFKRDVTRPDACKVPLAEGDFGLDDYIDYVIDFMAHLGPDTHVLAVCQPVVPVLAATAIMAEDNHPATPRSLALMGGPVDSRVNPTALMTIEGEKDDISSSGQTPVALLA